ncbi:hypothetical protein DFA_10701 [Cavenderia fasciculata]|uniref:Uncharacterized protein n=1 Tax=Cavenderia fasciculata TaxID=261658 RepID=F4QB56_CACFS|nr:uncharacterized protein DFA_10701 [Cavenderia fasciculata]EGG14828.1 hypothetical protein DFA_10701 [Cavenderia fasciculata]|eukprot:XP_004351344.1 hypothetical protein DFA_10701 [Cavenderia fasciculata]
MHNPSSEFKDETQKLAIERERKKKKKNKTNKDDDDGDDNSNNNYKQQYNDIITTTTIEQEKGQEGKIISWLLYLVVDESTLSPAIKKQSIYLLDKALKKYSSTATITTTIKYDWTLNTNILKILFNLLVLYNKEDDEDDETQPRLISILNTLNAGITDSEQNVEYLKLIENTIRKNRDNQVIREIILKIMESIDPKQLVSTFSSIHISENIMTYFLTDPSNDQYQFRVIDIIIRLKSTHHKYISIVEESDYNRYEFYSQELFSNHQVIQRLFDLLEWFIQSGNKPSFNRFINYIDPTKYKYVSSRIFPIMLKQLYEL